MRKAFVLVSAAVALSAPVGLTERAEAHLKADCVEIKTELKAQGATAWEVKFLGDKIAWRETGCKPQKVHRWNDWANNRFGMNACYWKDIPKARKQGKRPCKTNEATLNYWLKLCDADVRSDTIELSVDVRCALALLHKEGTKPWR